MEISYLYDILGQLTLKMPDTETLTSISHLKLVNVIERKENNYLFTVCRKKKYEKSPIEFEDVKVFRINNMSNSWFGVFNEEIRWVDQW